MSRVVGVGQEVWIGEPPDDGRHWTEIRCVTCGKSGFVLTQHLPLAAALTPIRNDDGVRVGTCATCARPNRAQRRRKR